VPHELTDMFDTQAPPQLWKPALHMNPQLVPSHVAVAFDGGTHGVHDAPHVITLVLIAQLAPQAW
jgi:hypothetical protein